MPGFGGAASFALPEFDPFWERVVEADMVVGMHASDSGYQRYINEWEGVPGGEMLPFKDGSGFCDLMHARAPRPSTTLASIIGHGLATRFPELQFLPVENGSHWVRPLVEHIQQAYEREPAALRRGPGRGVQAEHLVHPFHEEDPIGPHRPASAPTTCVFGSDYPHPEGMSDPLTYVDDLEGLPEEDKAKVMGGNLAGLMNVGVSV